MLSGRLFGTAHPRHLIGRVNGHAWPIKIKMCSPVPPVLQICQESRELDLKSYRRWYRWDEINQSEELQRTYKYFNPDLDTLLIHLEESIRDWMVGNNGCYRRTVPPAMTIIQLPNPREPSIRHISFQAREYALYSWKHAGAVWKNGFLKLCFHNTWASREDGAGNTEGGRWPWVEDWGEMWKQIHGHFQMAHGTNAHYGRRVVRHPRESMTCYPRSVC